MDQPATSTPAEPCREGLAPRFPVPGLIATHDDMSTIRQQQRAPRITRAMKRAIRKRAHLLSWLAYGRLARQLEADIAQGIVLPDALHKWRPALVRLD